MQALRKVPRSIRSRLRTVRTRALSYVLGCACGLLTGCASTTYQYGVKYPRPVTASDKELNSLTFGGEHPKLDKCERVVQYPVRKIRQWFRSKKGENLSEEEARRQAIYVAQEYLVLNELNDIKIDVREYDPAEQWRRLRENDRIHPFWKYTFGSLNHLQYAWIPGRVFHYDKYNPYTNTLSLNSSMPSMAVYEAAEAKVLSDRRYPGFYAASCHLPVVPLIKDVRVANDVLSYSRVREQWELEKQLYPQIYTAFGSDLVSQATSFIPSAAYLPFYYKPLLSAAGGVAGNLTGRAVLKEREMEQQLMSLGTQSAPNGNTTLR